MPVLDWKQLQDLVSQYQTGEIKQENQPWLDGWDASAPNAQEDYDNRFNAYLNSLSPRNMRNVANAQQEIESIEGDYSQEAFELGYGSERIDRKIPYDIFAENPNEARANRQTQLGKFVNGTLKAIPFTATTYIDNTIGILTSLLPYTPAGSLLTGALQGKDLSYKDLYQNIGDDSVLGRFEDTPFSRMMQNVRDWSEHALPNYRTQEEIDDADRWWRHLNGNFWGDVFFKNLGFTVGAGLSAGTWTKAFTNVYGKAMRNAYKAGIAAASGDAEAIAAFEKIANTKNITAKGLYDTLDKARKSYQKLNYGAQILGGFGGAVGESRVEAINAAKEYRDERIPDAWDEYQTGKQQLLDSIWSNPDCVAYKDVYDGYGNIIDKQLVLNDLGVAMYNDGIGKLQSKYERNVHNIDIESEDIANKTFWFNMPVVGGSNVIMFGKMLSGGYNTQARFKLRGKPGNYRGAGNTFTAVAGTLGKASMEGVEELTQKIISENAKSVADDKIADFYNSQYDLESVGDISSWINDLVNWAGHLAGTTADVLSDPQSWEEFAIGMLTGTMAAGVQRGFSGSIKQTKANQKEAENINNRMADPEFAKRWTGLVRHNYYEKQKDAALDAVITDDEGNTWRGDEFTWHTADSKQTISDIMMFADAGILDDLNDIVDAAANVSPDELKDLGVIDETDRNFKNKTSKQKLEWLTDRAKDIKDRIRQYRDFYDAVDVMTIGTTNPDVINELVFTQMQMRDFEKRYVRLMNEVSKKITPQLERISKKKDRSGNITEEAHKALVRLESTSMLERLFGNYENEDNEDGMFAVELDQETADKAIRELEDIGVFAKKPEIKKQIIDLQRLVRSRQKYYRSLVNPNFASVFSGNAKPAEEVIGEIKQEKAQKDTDGINTIGKMKAEYLSKPAKDREAFVSSLLETKRPAASEFAKLHDTFSEFKSKLAQKNPDLVNRRLGDFGTVPGIILNRLFEDSESAEDFVKKLDSPLMDIGSVNDILSQMVQAGAITEDEALPIMVNQMYSKTISAIKDMAEEFKKSWNNSAGKNSIKQEPEKKAAPVDDNANPTPAAKPSATKQDVKSEKKEEQVAEPAQQQEEKQESSDPITTEEASSDTNSTYTDNTIPEEDAYRRDDKGSVKLGYYQQSVPEIPTGDAKLVRELLLARKTASKEEMEVIDKQLNAIKIEDFVQFDDKGNPIGGEIGYADTVKWLRDNGAFKYISTELKPDQEVVFAIMDGAPKYEGKPQIVVATVSERNSNGEITRVQPLTILHSIDKAGDYIGLNELYDAIYADYDSTSPEGSLYIFGGKVNPKTSKVFGLRPGLMRYNRESTGVNIETIPDYNPDAPIIVLDDSNKPVLLRGNVDVSKLFIPNIYPWSSPHNGRLYYMVKNGSDTYTPVIIEKPTVTSNDVENAADGTYMAKIRDIASKIDEITSSLTTDNIQDSNNRLHKQLSELSKYYNIDGVAFSYDQKSGPGLNVNWITRHYVQGQEIVTEHNRDFQPGESITPLFDELDRKVRISYRPDNIEQSKKNLSSLISEGLITSNVSEFRQVGTNMLYDPWNKDTGKFERILPSTTPEQKSIPKSDKQTVAGDAEFGDTTVRDAEAQAPTITAQEQSSQPAAESKTLDDVFGEAGVIQEDVDYSLDYDDQSGPAKAKIDEKMSRDVWDRWKGNDKMRKKLMGC